MKRYFNLIDWDMGLHKTKKKWPGKRWFERTYKYIVFKKVQTSLTILKWNTHQRETHCSGPKSSIHEKLIARILLSNLLYLWKDLKLHLSSQERKAEERKAGETEKGSFRELTSCLLSQLWWSHWAYPAFSEVLAPVSSSRPLRMN